MRHLHVFEESCLVDTVSAFCEPWAFTIADLRLCMAHFVGANHSIYYARICICITPECFALEHKARDPRRLPPGGEDMRHLHVFEEGARQS